MRGDKLPDGARAILAASPRAVPLPKPGNAARTNCRIGSGWRCGRPATWAVDGVPLCVLDAYQSVRLDGAPAPESAP